jgi:hypothetical protein
MSQQMRNITNKPTTAINDAQLLINRATTTPYYYYYYYYYYYKLTYLSIGVTQLGFKASHSSSSTSPTVLLMAFHPVYPT